MHPLASRPLAASSFHIPQGDVAIFWSRVMSVVSKLLLRRQDVPMIHVR
jgi:hypothetical protein